jgi:hydrogenase 3 maturation protease
MGSELHGDDGATLDLINLIEKRRAADSRIKNKLAVFWGSTAPENCTGEIKAFNPDVVLIVDAADMGLAAGSIYEIPRGELNVSSNFTHGVPIQALAGYLEAECGCVTIVIGIQPANASFGAELSPEMKNSISILAQNFIVMM